MLNKPRDKFYCGVSQTKIDTANPQLNPKALKHMAQFITDRYNVRVKKDVQGLPSPWTDNKILQVGKFTNVRREHDRQTKEYIDCIANAKQSYFKDSWFDKFWNTVIFRMFNRIDMFKVTNIEPTPFYIEGLKGLIKPTVRNTLLELIEKRTISENLSLFTNAFNTGGLKQSLAIPEGDYSGSQIVVRLNDGLNVDYRPNREKFKTGEYLSDMYEPDMSMRILRYIGHVANGSLSTLHEQVMNAKSQIEVYNLLVNNIRGCSRFLAYQIFVDLSYCNEFPFSENHFTVSGPGCDAGLNILFDDFDGLNKEEALFWLRDNQFKIFDIDFTKLFYDLEVHDQCLNIQALENLHCEFSKYMRGVEAIERGEKPRFKVSTAKLVNPPLLSTKADSKSNTKLW